MKLKFFLPMLLSALLLSCDNDDYPYAEIPSVVLNHFWTEYPDAADVDFSPEGDNYEVDFEIEDKDHKALISISGKILKQKKEIDWKALPPEVQHTIGNEYEEKDIKDIELVRWGELIYYQAEIRQFLSNEKITLDKTGKKDPTLSYWK